MLKTPRTVAVFLKFGLERLNVTVGDDEETRGECNYLCGALSANCAAKCLLLGLCFSMRGVD